MRRGFTLVETLLTIALLGLTLTIAWQILLPSWRIWTINEKQAGLEENGLVIETHVLRDIERSTLASMTVQVPPGGVDPATGLQAVSFATTGTEDGPDSFDSSSGHAIWQSYVIYYVPIGTGRLYRKVWPVPWLPAASQTPPSLSPGQAPAAGPLPYTFPNSAPVPLAAADLATLCTVPNGTETLLGSDLHTLRVDPVTGSAATATLTLELATPSPLGLASSQRVRQFHFWM